MCVSLNKFEDTVLNKEAIEDIKVSLSRSPKNFFAGIVTTTKISIGSAFKATRVLSLIRYKICIRQVTTGWLAGRLIMLIVGG